MAALPPKVFLTGATGDIGGQTLKLMQGTNVKVRVMCRRQAQVDKFRKDNVDAVLGSLDDSADEMAKHMEGCDRMLLITAATPDMLQHGINATDAAIKAGLKWIIKISASDAREEGNVPWAIAHAVGDRYLREQCQMHQLSWTLLSPSGFMGNLLSSAPAVKKGLLPQTGGDGKCGWIDSRDIAAVASQVLIDGPEKHHEQNYILTGPKLISFPEIAQAFSRQIGHKVRYLHLPAPVFGALLRFSGLDAWMADGLVAQFAEIVRQNDERIEVSDATEKITGKPPMSIDDFAARNKDALQGFDIVPYAGAVAVFVAAVCAKSLL